MWLDSMTDRELLRLFRSIPNPSGLEGSLATRLEKVLDELEREHGDDAGGQSKGGGQEVDERQMPLEFLAGVERDGGARDT